MTQNRRRPASQLMILDGLLRGTYPSDSDNLIVGVRLGELRELNYALGLWSSGKKSETEPDSQVSAE